MTTPPERNIPPLQVFKKIEEEGSVLDQLDNLAHRLENRTVETINWYLHQKEGPKQLSRWIRGIAILLAILGGLSPLTAGAGFL